MRYLLLSLALLFTSVAEARYCDQIQCKMCNRIFGPMPGYQLNSDYSAVRARSVRYTPPLQTYTPQPQVTYSQPAPSPAIPDKILHALDPTPQSSIETMLSLVDPTPGDILYDLGSGDGRILITASQEYGTPGIGIEINPETADLSRIRLKEAGVDNVTIATGNATDFDISYATIVTMYLYPPVIKSLIPNLEGLKSGTRVVSFSHPIPLAGTRKITVDDETFYLWIKP